MPEVSYDDVVEWPVWSGYLQRAWHVLSSDRHYGAMGGMARIYYSSISRYARDNSMQLEPFTTFIQAMDDEYVSHVLANQKENIETE